MKASELRAGNYVQGEPISVPKLEWYSDGVQQLTAYGIFQIEVGHLHFEPIPLSEEWLKRFGFERHHNNKSLFVEQTQTGGVELMKDGTFEFCIGDIFFEAKYVHQLQNLYFALTGEELTLKEK